VIGDLGGDLVPEHERERRREEAVDDVEVGVTDAAGEDPADDLVLALGGRHSALLELERTVERTQDDGAHQASDRIRSSTVEWPVARGTISAP